MAMLSCSCWRALSLGVQGAHKIANLLKGIILALPASKRFLLVARVHLIEGIATKLDYTKGVKHAACVLELVINSGLTVCGRRSSITL